MSLDNNWLEPAHDETCNHAETPSRTESAVVIIGVLCLLGFVAVACAIAGVK